MTHYTAPQPDSPSPNTYLLSLERKVAAVYKGKKHRMSILAAARRFAQDTFVVTYCGEGHLAQDVLKMRSNGECHLSITERNLIKEAK